MTEPVDYDLIMLVLGSLVLMLVPLRQVLHRICLPGLIGFVALGMVLSAINQWSGALTPVTIGKIEFLAQLCIVALLFRVGLASNPGRLAAQLGRAAAIWLPNMALPGLAAFTLILLWPGFGPMSAVIMGIAANATSIGLSVAPWDEAGALDTEEAALMLDVAELDYLSTVVVLGIFFAVAAALQGELSKGVWIDVGLIGVLQVLEILGFSVLCFAFLQFAEPGIAAVFAGLDRTLGSFVSAAGTIFVIASIIDSLGFSMAIGALFAGLAFSRDTAERRIDEAFAFILTVFGPFFFLSIGLSITFKDFSVALPIAVALFLVLVAGKLTGAGLPARATARRRTGQLIGACMVPRAEICLIVMLHGLALAAWAEPQELYTAIVLAAVGTCVAGPLLVVRLLGSGQRGRQTV